jgi:hypothetical protein
MTAQQCFHKSMYGEACKQPMEGKMVSREWHWEQAIKYAVESFNSYGLVKKSGRFRKPIVILKAVRSGPDIPGALAIRSPY